MPLTNSSAPKMLGDGNTVGVILGSDNGFDSAGNPEKIALYGGTTPVAQPSNANQNALTRGLNNGILTHYATTQSPTSVANNTTAEKSFTVQAGTGFAIQPGSNDIFFVNKPTAQAGLGMGNVRVASANTVGVTFSNFSAATITPTASEVYQLIGIRGMTVVTASLSPAAVPPNTIAEQQFTVASQAAGLVAGQIVKVVKPTAQAGLDIMGARIVSNNVVGITFGNLTAATITPTASETYKFLSHNAIDALDNCVLYEVLASPAAVANATSAEQAVAVTGPGTNDVVVGVSKPTAQAGLGIVGWRVSAANSLGVTFGNFTAATITPTASEVYSITVLRPNRPAASVMYTPALTPVSVAANTTAEQTFTVTGLVASSFVFVNKPTATPGLGIVGVRVSAADTLAITYGNATSAAITPPAETYLVMNFQAVSPGAGNSVSQYISQAVDSVEDLVAALRLANTNIGLILGR